MTPKKEETRYEVPPFKGSVIAILFVVSGVSWLFRLFGVTWEELPVLKWTSLVSSFILVLIYLPKIMAKARKHGDL